MAKKPMNWRRVLRPLWWWLLLVFILFAIHTHQRLMEQTRLFYSISLNGQPLPYSVSVTLDGEPFNRGDNLWLGSHRFQIACPKTDPFATNLNIWYGRHDLGEIRLQRSMGTLSVVVQPPANVIHISGDEFSLTLTNSVGTNVVVPTDIYSVRSDYPHWSVSRPVVVAAHQTAGVNFSPKFGSLHLTSNKPDSRFELRSDEVNPISGELPVTLNDLPVGNYSVTVFYHQRRLNQSAVVAADATNEAPFTFALGSVVIQSTPSGAEVKWTNGDFIGVTPLQLNDLPPQTMQFNLSAWNYEPATVTVPVVADMTNTCSTMLTGVNYAGALSAAKTYLQQSNYPAALQSARVALASKPDDVAATEVQHQAQAALAVQKALAERRERPRKEFDNLCAQYDDAQFFEAHELKTDKPAKAVATAIVAALQGQTNRFDVPVNVELAPDIYNIMAQRDFLTGILIGCRQVAVVVVGQAADKETQIYYKVLEYRYEHVLAGPSVFTLRDHKQLTPLTPGRIQMTPAYQAEVENGWKLVAERIQQGIEAAK